MLLARKLFKPCYLAARSYQVTVAGGATEVGQTLCLLLRAQSNITKLVVFDTPDYTPGVTVDLSHVPADTSIVGFNGYESLDRALTNSDIVIAVGGALQTPGIPLKSWRLNNNDFIKTLAARVAKLHPMPLFAIATEPINSLVPMAAEVMRNNGHCDAKKLFGITTIDALRAQALYASTYELDPYSCFVPVIGGHSDQTVVPLLSQAIPEREMSETEAQTYCVTFRQANERIIRAKRGWAPTLSIAYSVLLFTRSLLKALEGEPAHVNAYIENNYFGTSYFSGLVEVDKHGIVDMQRYHNLTPFECSLIELSIEQIRKDILHGKKILEIA